MPIVLSETKIIDVAIMGQCLTPIEKMDNYHVVKLDNINIEEDLFKSIFYCHEGENFSIIRNTNNNPTIESMVSFESKYRTYNNKTLFNLSNIIFAFIEEDLNINRDCFDTCCKMELEKQLSYIKTLCDLDLCNILCALKWSEIIQILKSKGAKSFTDGGIFISHILKINIVFSNPNTSVKDTIITFSYVIESIDGL